MCIGLWVWKNSSSENSRKIHLARMPYKRFSRTGWTFSITGFEVVCAENEFFNTHGFYRQLRFNYWPVCLSFVRNDAYTA
jgi:hypothetical protein